MGSKRATITNNLSDKDNDFSKLYRDEVARNKLKLVLIHETLNISVDEYFALFIDDKAPHSYDRCVWMTYCIFYNYSTLGLSLI